MAIRTTRRLSRFGSAAPTDPEMVLVEERHGVDHAQRCRRISILWLADFG
jgi:hypothetical protein